MSSKVLVVDDIELNRAILEELLSDEYEVVQADGGAQAIKTLENRRTEIALVLLDIVMPEVSGYDVLSFMKFNGLLEKIPVILITAAGSNREEEKGLEMGAVDFIRKPFSPSIVKRRIQTMMQLYRYQNGLEELIREKTEALSGINATIVAVLTSVLEKKTIETKEHIQRIRLYTNELLQYVYEYYDDNIGTTTEQISMMGMASILHDVGELVIPEEIIKREGKRTPEEQAIFEQHTVKGCQLIEPLRNIESEFYTTYCYNICRYHHERWDGSGYPDKLSGNHIPLCAQAVGLVHVYDELMCLYGGNHEKAMNILVTQEANKFSPVLMETLKLIGDNFLEIYRNNLEPKF
ncbi:MAG: response regulator [Christensenella sp.]|nr:response regulator [Christensenella sp.]